MRKPTFEITGEWSGPRCPAGDWTRIVHREYTKDAQFVANVRYIESIMYGDGTFLFLTVKEMKPGEKKQTEKHGYTSLIRDCADRKCNSVDQLVNLQKAEKLGKHLLGVT